jgi:hypothetical protein
MAVEVILREDVPNLGGIGGSFFTPMMAAVSGWFVEHRSLAVSLVSPQSDAGEHMQNGEHDHEGRKKGRRCRHDRSARHTNL